LAFDEKMLLREATPDEVIKWHVEGSLGKMLEAVKGFGAKLRSRRGDKC
jgi:hypothetical protein